MPGFGWSCVDMVGLKKSNQGKVLYFIKIDNAHYKNIHTLQFSGAIWMCPKVMVVDDEPDTIDLLKLVLGYEKIDVIGAHSGIECLELMDTVDPDAILLDLMMPEMNGLETFHKIKEKDPQIPVAIITVKNQEYDKMHGIHVLKADDYITKSFSRKDMIERTRCLVALQKRAMK
jgi:two-component system response regulator VicR